MKFIKPLDAVILGLAHNKLSTAQFRRIMTRLSKELRPLARSIRKEVMSQS